MQGHFELPEHCSHNAVHIVLFSIGWCIRICRFILGLLKGPAHIHRHNQHGFHGTASQMWYDSRMLVYGTTFLIDHLHKTIVITNMLVIYQNVISICMTKTVELTWRIFYILKRINKTRRKYSVYIWFTIKKKNCL